MQRVVLFASSASRSKILVLHGFMNLSTCKLAHDHPTCVCVLDVRRNLTPPWHVQACLSKALTCMPCGLPCAQAMWACCMLASLPPSTTPSQFCTSPPSTQMWRLFWRASLALLRCPGRWELGVELVSGPVCEPSQLGMQA